MARQFIKPLFKASKIQPIQKIKNSLLYPAFLGDFFQKWYRV